MKQKFSELKEGVDYIDLGARESKEIWENENSIVYLRSKVEKEIQKQQHEKP